MVLSNPNALSLLRTFTLIDQTKDQATPSCSPEVPTIYGRSIVTPVTRIRIYMSLVYFRSFLTLKTRTVFYQQRLP